MARVYACCLPPAEDICLEAIFRAVPAARWQKARAFAQAERRLESLAAYALVAFALEKEMGLPAWPALEGSGKPRVAGWPGGANLSHTRGLVACAVGQGQVGVDCERVRETLDGALARRLTSPAEYSALFESPPTPHGVTEMFTLKESIAKLDGGGIRRLMQGVPLLRRPDGQWQCGLEGIKVATQSRGGAVVSAAAYETIDTPFTWISWCELERWLNLQRV
nr:4'-phosphopantetheinyl transferase superfamily protein [bacterium]